jgi:tetratricopeptide (TPR) repeat protein
MLRGVFRTKEGKIIAAVLGAAIIIISIFAFTGYSQNKKFVEQAVMAENYLKGGNYEQAIEAYLKALSMKNSDEELLTVGLADSYAGTKEYDKALEALRTCYEKTSGVKIKEKIEEITSEKTDYEYLQSISHAEVYFTNNEYEKAITEFEKAKQIKSKEALSYQRIADAYIEMGKYDLAREEVLEGQEITQDSSLEITLSVVDSYIMKAQYDALVTQASEYVLQENVEDGIARYEEAITLLPKETAAYRDLANLYISRKEYEKAVLLLEGSPSLTDSEELRELLNQATEQNKAKEEMKKLLSNLYSALEKRNTAAVTTIMDLALFKEKVTEDAPVYYSDDTEASGRTGMIIYDSKRVYFGDIKDGIKSGIGIYFIRTEGNAGPGYYYYDGKWNKDLPNGTGETVEEIIARDDTGQKYSARTVTEGYYHNAYEDGNMIKHFYINNAETGMLNYTAKNGIPDALSDGGSQPSLTPGVGSYIIGMLTQNGQPTGDYYRVEADTIWGVKPFINK